MTITARNLIAPRFTIILLSFPRYDNRVSGYSHESPDGGMSTLRHERLGSDIPEPDSELRAALQRVARDLEQDSRHLEDDQNLDLQQDKHGEGIHRIRHREGTSIHVEDILDEVSSYQSAIVYNVNNESSSA